MTGRLNSSMLWNKKGWITADEAFGKVVEKSISQEERSRAKQQRKEQQAADREERRLAGTLAVDILCKIVACTGSWKGGRGGCTTIFLTQVILWLNGGSSSRERSRRVL